MSATCAPALVAMLPGLCADAVVRLRRPCIPGRPGRTHTQPPTIDLLWRDSSDRPCVGCVRGRSSGDLYRMWTMRSVVQAKFRLTSIRAGCEHSPRRRLLPSIRVWDGCQACRLELDKEGGTVARRNPTGVEMWMKPSHSEVAARLRRAAEQAILFRSPKEPDKSSSSVHQGWLPTGVDIQCFYHVRACNTGSEFIPPQTHTDTKNP